jgi:hypothetical protein
MLATNLFVANICFFTLYFKSGKSAIIEERRRTKCQETTNNKRQENKKPEPVLILEIQSDLE